VYISLLARSRGKTFLCVISLWSRDLCASDSNSSHSVDVQFVQTRSFLSLSSGIFTCPIKSWDYSPPIRQTPPICIVMSYFTPRKLPCIAVTYFFWLATGTLGVLPTVAPVCMGASGMGTSLKSSWPIALMVYVSVAKQLAARSFVWSNADPTYRLHQRSRGEPIQFRCF
jgi:hypothetical protein